MTDDSTPGVIAPPPLIFLAGLLCGLAADRLWAIDAIRGDAWTFAGSVLCLVGLAVMILGSVRFKSAGTPARPWRPSSALVVDGIYRITRNPMYLGMALVYLGLALIFGDIVTLALLIPVLLLIRFGVILREERYLTSRFGDDYRDYMSRTRRWL